MDKREKIAGTQPSYMDFGKAPPKGTPEYEEWGMEVGRKLKQQAVAKIKQAIKERGLSQMQISRDTGISQPSLSLFLTRDDAPLQFHRLMFLLEYLGFKWELNIDGVKTTKPVKAPRGKKRSKPRKKKNGR